MNVIVCNILYINQAIYENTVVDDRIHEIIFSHKKGSYAVCHGVSKRAGQNDVVNMYMVIKNVKSDRLIGNSL